MAGGVSGSRPARNFNAIPNHFENVTPADADLKYPAVGFMVATTGNVRVLPAAGDTPVDIPAIGGVQYAMSFIQLMQTGTGAVGTCVVFYGQ